MSKPDIILSKIGFVIFIFFLVCLILSLIIVYFQLSGECNNPNYNNNKPNKNKGMNITILLFVILACSMTAQAINQSYTRTM